MRLGVFFIVLLLFVNTQKVCAQISAELFENLRSAQTTEEKCAATRTIAKAYQATSSYTKAIEYYQKALNCGQEDPSRELTNSIYEGLATSHLQLNQQEQALLYYLKMEQGANSNERVEIYKKVAQIFQKQRKIAQALDYNLKIESLLTAATPKNEVMELYNNIGYLYRELNDNSKSLEYFTKVQDMSRSNQNVSKATQIAYLLNMGVSYTNIKQYRTAQVHYLDALKMAESLKDMPQQARIHNYIAVNYYLNNDTRMAVINANKAIEKADGTSANDALINAYLLLYDINQREENLADAQRYYQLAQNLKEKLAKQESAAQQALLAKQVEAERKENEIQNMIAERERQDAQLKQSELERNKQEQELALRKAEVARLKQEQELQESRIDVQKAEKQRIQQLLEITKQKAIADEQQGIIENQKLLSEKERAENQRLISERESEKNARIASELAAKQENQRRLQELEQNKFRNTILTVVISLIVVILALVIYFLWNSNKSNKRLKHQQSQINEQNQALRTQAQEILAQNAELQIKQEEILAQREAISLKNNELEDKSKIITSSINAAMHIQRSILPRPNEVTALMGEHFIINMPRDVVSGDFFWIDAVHKHVVIATIDCTGHGVEGAFMTIIGKTLFDKIVVSEQLTEPQDILNALHLDIKKILRQDETGNNNGMDASIVRLTKQDDDHTECLFSGARNAMIYIKPDSKVYEIIKGTRKSLGGKQNEDKTFEKITMRLPKGVLLYLGTDGLTDQNNPRGERFGKQRMVKILIENAHKPMLGQKKALEEALKDHAAGLPQRDDILMLGLRI